MKFETKFNIGEYAFIIHNNKLVAYTIDNIQVISNFDGNKGMTTINYSLSSYKETVIRQEEELYKTKEELLNSL